MSLCLDILQAPDPDFNSFSCSWSWSWSWYTHHHRHICSNHSSTGLLAAQTLPEKYTKYVMQVYVCANERLIGQCAYAHLTTLAWGCDLLFSIHVFVLRNSNDATGVCTCLREPVVSFVHHIYVR